ncbi:MAG: DNA polymerase III subunit beta [Candidatus Pacebacteria bacterium]|nr:DNA polymerase III subunit beta [Candidatus Paceibacterota bacterium]PIR60894.1 MAG: DNA polymerase III subunit beta [Candidatus Pacebacteria bacterium CG10_big_fil_rev_8_21_14_0_10_44_54]
MKFLVSKTTFHTTLQKLQRVLPNKPQLPTLAAIHILVKKNRVILTATDLYLGIQAPLESQIESEGVVVVPGKLLLAAVSSFPEGEIVVTETAGTLNLVSRASKVKLQTLSLEEYPEFPEVSGESVLLATSDLLSVEQYVLPSVSKDITRPVLTAVQLELTTTTFRAVGTDGFRLSVFGTTTESEHAKTLLAPARTLLEYIKLAQAEEVSNVELLVSSKLQQVLAKIGDVLVFSRLVTGEYPPFEQIIPSESTTEVVCEADELLEQVRRAHVLTSGSSHIVQFRISPELVEISTPTTTEGSFEGVLTSAKVTGNPLKIAFNAVYLLDMLKQFSSQELRLGMTEALKPVIFRSQTLSSFLYVVMPFRVV